MLFFFSLFTATFAFLFFFFNDTAPTEIYTLSLHDALPIVDQPDVNARQDLLHALRHVLELAELRRLDRKSTRLNSSHVGRSYAVFCLKKKNRRDGMGRQRGGYQLTSPRVRRMTQA